MVHYYGKCASQLKLQYYWMKTEGEFSRIEKNQADKQMDRQRDGRTQSIIRPSFNGEWADDRKRGGGGYRSKLVGEI